MKFCISECRNSDSIIVIHGTSYDFNNQTNQPNENIWKTNHNSFNPEKYTEAAKHILSIIKLAIIKSEELVKKEERG